MRDYWREFSSPDVACCQYSRQGINEERQGELGAGWEEKDYSGTSEGGFTENGKSSDAASQRESRSNEKRNGGNSACQQVLSFTTGLLPGAVANTPCRSRNESERKEGKLGEETTTEERTTSARRTRRRNWKKKLDDKISSNSDDSNNNNNSNNYNYNNNKKSSSGEASFALVTASSPDGLHVAGAECPYQSDTTVKDKLPVKTPGLQSGMNAASRNRSWNEGEEEEVKKNRRKMKTCGGDSGVTTIRIMPLWSLWLACFTLVWITDGTSAHLVKEFTSAGREAARSMESSRDRVTGLPNTRGSVDVSAVLCEKYSGWSKWSPCSRKCEQTRVRRCKIPEECGRSWVKEKRTCTREKGACVPLSYKVIGMQKRNRMIEELLYDMLYAQWTSWGPCTRSCRQRRQRWCKYREVCVKSYIQEERRCQLKGSECEHRYSLKPMAVGTDPGDDETEDEEDEDEKYNGSDANGSYPGEDDFIEGPGDDVSVERGNVKEENKNESKNDTETNIPEEVFGTLGPRKGGRGRRKLPGKKARRGPRIAEEVMSAQKHCGIRPKKTSGSYRVVGGQEVQKNSWPWQVALLTKFKEQYCGGTLIAPKWVLTAAHCVRKKGKRRRLIVRVGEHDIDLFDPTQEDIRPEKEFPHPDFDYHTITNDIALIKLRHAPSAYTLSGYACLPKSEDYAPSRNQQCTIVGWGKLKNTHIYGSDSLQEAQVPVVRQRKCQRVFDYAITSSQVCAGYKRGGIDSCAGDSGGPLLCATETNGTERHVIFGVTSYGEGCGRKGKYGIYTKVTSYLDWIYKTIRKER